MFGESAEVCYLHVLVPEHGRNGVLDEAKLSRTLDEGEALPDSLWPSELFLQCPSHTPVWTGGGLAEPMSFSVAPVIARH